MGCTRGGHFTLAKRKRSKKWKDILAPTNAAGVREADVYDCFIRHLKTLFQQRKGRMTLYNLLMEVFGTVRLQDASFVYFLSITVPYDTIGPLLFV